MGCPSVQLTNGIKPLGFVPYDPGRGLRGRTREGCQQAHAKVVKA
jgi:hypothetical protein